MFVKAKPVMDENGILYSSTDPFARSRAEIRCVFSTMFCCWFDSSSLAVGVAQTCVSSICSSSRSKTKGHLLESSSHRGAMQATRTETCPTTLCPGGASLLNVISYMDRNDGLAEGHKYTVDFHMSVEGALLREGLAFSHPMCAGCISQGDQRKRTGTIRSIATVLHPVVPIVSSHTEANCQAIVVEIPSCDRTYLSMVSSIAWNLASGKHTALSHGVEMIDNGCYRDPTVLHSHLIYPCTLQPLPAMLVYPQTNDDSSSPPMLVRLLESLAGTMWWASRGSSGEGRQECSVGTFGDEYRHLQILYEILMLQMKIDTRYLGTEKKGFPIQ